MAHITRRRFRSVAVGGGRLYVPDARDRRYPAARLLDAGPLVTPHEKFWSEVPVSNQWLTPKCVAHAAHHVLLGGPVKQRPGAVPSIDELYIGAQEHDEWTGSSYDGTSARGVSEYLRATGHVGGYVHAFTEPELWTLVLTKGPALLGLTMYSTMMDTTRDGYMVGSGYGGIEGGHEVCAMGASTARQAYRCDNSWGESWGDGGRFWLPREEVAHQLQHAGADALVWTEQRMSKAWEPSAR